MKSEAMKGLDEKMVAARSEGITGIGFSFDPTASNDDVARDLVKMLNAMKKAKSNESVLGLKV